MLDENETKIFMDIADALKQIAQDIHWLRDPKLIYSRGLSISKEEVSEQPKEDKHG